MVEEKETVMRENFETGTHDNETMKKRCPQITLIFFIFFIICVNLCHYVAKPCFHSKIFPLELAYSCCNNRLGVPPPLCNLWTYFHSSST